MDNTFLQLVSLVVQLTNQVAALQQEKAALQQENAVLKTTVPIPSVHQILEVAESA